MKRLGIFCFYDPFGIVDSYVEYLLDELMTVLDRLIIVVNGQVNETGRRIFERLTNDLLIRENRGFDAGAYADVIKNVVGESINEWDEVVLCNDTFFGPFVPMRSVFDDMEGRKVDFWGLNLVDRRILGHIQSYFLVFGPKIIQSGELVRFFETNIDPLEDEVTDVYGKFEIGLFRYLTEKRYSYETYANTDMCSVYKSPDVCIARYHLPILKKSAFAKNYCSAEATSAAIRYLKANTDYDTAHILRCITRLYGICGDIEDVIPHVSEPERMPVKIANCRYSEAELDTRIGSRDFYIYGTGMVARNLFYASLHLKKGLKGFVVSDNRGIKKPIVCGLPVFHYSEIEKDALIVLGVNKENAEAIKETIDAGAEIVELWE